MCTSGRSRLIFFGALYTIANRHSDIHQHKVYILGPQTIGIGFFSVPEGVQDFNARVLIQYVFKARPDKRIVIRNDQLDHFTRSSLYVLGCSRVYPA